MVNGLSKVWLFFKYENLLTLCFHCGKLGHGVKDCKTVQMDDSETLLDSYPYSVALRVDSPFFGKESLKYGYSSKKSMTEFYYEGEIETDVQGEEATIGGVPPSMLPAIDVHNLKGRNLGNFFPKSTSIFNDRDLENPMEGNSAMIKELDVGIDKSTNYCYNDVTMDKETVFWSNRNRDHTGGINNFPKLVR